jgi:tetratricopeptide (TPR) repeat protein
LGRRIKNCSAFELRLLKVLVNFRIHNDATIPLSNKDLEALSKEEDRINGKVKLTSAYLKEIWNFNGEIAPWVSKPSLNEFCRILDEKYTWTTFVNLIKRYRPKCIPDEIPFSELDKNYQNQIEKAIDDLLVGYTDFVKFKIEKLENRVITENNTIVIKESIRNKKVNIINKKPIIISITCIAFFCIYIFFSKKHILLSNEIAFEKSTNLLFDTSKHTYNILLLLFNPIDTCEKQSTGIENAIITRLREMNTLDSLDLQISFKPIQVENINAAHSIGKAEFADLVIWGDFYEKCNSPNEACIKYVQILNEDKIHFNKSTIETISPKEISNGKLQYDINYLIYWIAGFRNYRKSSLEKAIKFFKEALRWDNENFHNDKYFYLYMSYFYLKEMDSAKVYIKKALNYKDESSFIDHFYLAQIAHFYDKDYDVAQEHYKKALALSPTALVLLADYGYFLENCRYDTIGAKEYYRKALLIDSLYLPVLNRLLSLNKFGVVDRRECKILFKRMIYYLKKESKNTQDLSNPYLLYANFLCYRMNDLKGAIYYYKKAIELDTTNSNAYYYFGLFFKNVEGNEYDSLSNYYFTKAKILDSIKIKFPYQKSTETDSSFYIMKQLKIAA